jgi:hypothetical protein
MNPLPRGALVAARPRRVLVFCDLPAGVRDALVGFPATLTDAESVLGTVALLADRDFDAVILDLTLSSAMVMRLKTGLGELADVPEEVVARARERQRLTPFFLVMDRERQFAVVVDPPEHSYVESGAGLSLPDAVARLEVSKLVMQGAALA